MRRHKKLRLDSTTIRQLKTAQLDQALGGHSLHCTVVGHSLCVGVQGCSGGPNC